MSRQNDCPLQASHEDADMGMYCIPQAKTTHLKLSTCGQAMIMPVLISKLSFQTNSQSLIWCMRWLLHWN